MQLAKAAIQSGMMLLLEQAVVSVEDIQELYVAGVFGGFVNPGSAKQMGLLPSIDDKKIIFVGNAAGKGAGEALCDPKFIDMLQEHIAYIILNWQSRQNLHRYIWILWKLRHGIDTAIALWH